MKLPAGVDNVEELRKEGFYHVDKTGLIADLLNHRGEEISSPVRVALERHSTGVCTQGNRYAEKERRGRI